MEKWVWWNLYAEEHVHDDNGDGGVAGLETKAHTETKDDSKRFLSKAGSENRQELRTRRPETVWKVWQTTRSTDLFGVTAYHVLVYKIAR